MIIGKRNMKKVILINIIASVFILLSAELYLYTKDKEYPFIFTPSSINHPSMEQDYKTLKEKFYSKGNLQEIFLYRRPTGLNYKNKPIIIFGCSFAWGARLSEEQTLHYKLSELTHRPVYNRAISGWGVQHMLYQLMQDDLYSELPEPEYVVFVYISNHISRMYKYNFIYNYSRKYSYNYLKYNEKGDNLLEEKRVQNILYSRIWNHYILRFIAILNEKNENKSFKLLEKHFIKAKEEINKHWKNTKFIILNYETECEYNNYPNILNKNNINKLLKDGFYVINTSDLTDIKLNNEYWLDEYDSHPNEAAWDLITPLLVKELDKISKSNR